MNKLLMILLIMFLPLTASAEGLMDYIGEYNIEEFVNYDLEIFQDFDLKEIQQSLISGEGFDSMNIIKKVVGMVTSELRSYLKMFLMLIICGFIIGIGTGGEVLSGKNKEAVRCVGYCIFAGMLCILYMDITKPALEYIEYISVTGKSLCTVLIGITYAKGGAVTGTLMNSGLIVMLNLFIDIFTKILIPLITSSALVSVADNFSDRIKVKALATNLRSATKWILGFILSLFTGIFGVYGVAGSGIDITIRKAAKMAVGTALPVVGGVVADSMETVGAILKGVSNIVGVSGIIIIVIYATVPLIKLLVLRWGLKICIVILEPFSAKEITGVSENICECITYIFAIFCAGLLLVCSMVGILMVAGGYI